MTAQIGIQKAMNEALVQARIRNPAYSLRAFARKLALSPAAVSEILSGKRRVSKKLATRIVQNLGLDPERSQGILGLFPAGKIQEPQPSSEGHVLSAQERMQLSVDEFRAIADWYHYAILSLAETKGFKDDPAWIANRLGVRVHDVRSALERLEKLGMLKRLLSGKLKGTGRSFTSSDEVVSLALRKAHAQNLELARNSLEQDPIESRDFIYEAMAIDVAKMPEAKKIVRECLDKLAAVLETGQRTEVYHLCFQMFPITKPSEENDENDKVEMGA